MEFTGSFKLAQYDDKWGVRSVTGTNAMLRTILKLYHLTILTVKKQKVGIQEKS